MLEKYINLNGIKIEAKEEKQELIHRNVMIPPVNSEGLQRDTNMDPNADLMKVRENVEKLMPPFLDRKFYSKKEETAFHEKLTARRKLLASEIHLNAAPVGKFKMKSKWLRGYFARKSDEKKAVRIRADHGNNADINYRSCRVMEKWQTAKGLSEDSEKEIKAAVNDAFSWELSFNMLAQNVMADKTPEIKRFYEQAKLLRDTVYDPEYSKLYGDMSEERLKELLSIIETASPLIEGVELTLNEMGLAADKMNAVAYRDKTSSEEERSKRTERLNELKKEFALKREKLDELDRDTLLKMESRGDPDLLPKTYFSKNTAASKVFENVSKTPGFDAVDALFAETEHKAVKGNKNKKIADDKMRTEAKKWFFTTMETDSIDFTDVEKYLEVTEKKIKENWKKKHDIEPRLTDSEEKMTYRFKHVAEPNIRRVFRLVNEGKVGKDAARLYLTPEAMCRTFFDLETVIYTSLALRSKEKQEMEVPDEKCTAYYNEVKELARLHASDETTEYDPRTDKQVKDWDDNIIDPVLCTKKDGKTKTNSAILGGSHFIFFPVNAKEEDNARCYVTAKPDCQAEVIKAVRIIMQNNPKYLRAFHFKVPASAHSEKKDNIVFYLKPSTDMELFRAFLKEVNDTASEFLDEDNIKTGDQLYKGISMVSEPASMLRFAALGRVEIYGSALNQGAGNIEKTREKKDVKDKNGKKKTVSTAVYGNLSGRFINASTNSSEVKNPENGKQINIAYLNLSWNQVYSKFTAMAAMVAKHRLGVTDNDKKITEDPKVLSEMNQIIQEFLEMSGLNVNTMMSHELDDK